MYKNNRLQSFSAKSRKTIHASRSGFLGGIASLLFVSFSSGFAGQSVSLSWEANSEPDITGYKVHCGTSQKDIRTIDVGNKTTVTVPNLKDRTTYYFAVTAYNRTAKESSPSVTLSYMTAPSSPEEASEIIVNGGAGSGSYAIGSQVKVSAGTSPDGKPFSGWLGDTAVLANPFIPTTTATVTSLGVSVTATYEP